MTEEIVRTAAKSIEAILSLAIQHTHHHHAIIISDKQCALAMKLTEAYRIALPTATFIDFDAISAEEIFALFKTLKPRDLVVLIQSTSFRLKDFRIRVELFEQSLKVIEHPHLARMSDPQEERYYIESLAYDPDYFRGVGHRLKKGIDQAQQIIVESEGENLIFTGPFESAKLNIGDYTDMKNIGGQFPIGEVFTEAVDLESVNGRVRIFAFADTSYSVNLPEQPITLVIDKGRVVDAINATPEFEKVLANIRADEKEVWLRELGFGMNRAFTDTRLVTDVGTYERMCGIHLSLGAKHSVYKKPRFKRNDSWHHVDVFAKTNAVYLDDQRIFENGEWLK